MSSPDPFERSGLFVSGSTGADGAETYGAEMLGPEAVALAALITARQEEARAAYRQARAARLQEIDRMRPRSAGKVLARIQDTLIVTRYHMDLERQAHRPPSGKDRALELKLLIELNILEPHMVRLSNRRGFVPKDPGAGAVAADIEASPQLTRWQEESAARGPETLTTFNNIPQQGEQLLPVSTFLHAAADLCNRLYTEASASL